MRTSAVWPVLVGVGLLAGIVAAGIGALALVDALTATGLPDPGPITTYGLPFVRAAGEIAGSDVMDDKEYPVRDTAYSMLYTAETPEEARELFEKMLGGGGTVGMPLEVAPWGDLYGQVFDRFGVMWAFTCENMG